MRLAFLPSPSPWRRGARPGTALALALALGCAGLTGAAPVAADPAAGAGPAAAPSVEADRFTPLGRGARVELRRDPAPQSELSVIPPPERPRSQSGGFSTSTAASTWDVSYVGAWPQQAVAAFQAAVDTWAQLLVSPRTIRVRAEWKHLGSPNLLGAAGPNILLDTRTNTVYPEALINAVENIEADPDNPDVFAEFNSSATGVYFGTDGRPATNQVDFRTIVLHELGHGLGWAGSGDVEGGRGYWGVQFQGRPAPSPVVYDRFVVRNDGSSSQSILGLQNGSTALAAALTGGQLFWDGAEGRAAAGQQPRLYAPSPFELGSSYSHLDEATYPRGHPDSLMTPFIGNGEVIHDPGPIALGVLEDQGWTVQTAQGSRYTPLDPVRILQEPNGSGVRLGPGVTRDLRVAGVHGVPADATAVVLNLTGVAPSETTDVRAYPTPAFGTGFPVVSNLNLARGITRANLVTVPVGSGGRVRLRNQSGTVGLLADLAGYYAPNAQSGFTPVDPVRVLDTREGLTNTVGGLTDRGRRTPVGAGETLDLQVTGGGSRVPAGATAVVLTVTAAGATAPTDVRVYPAPAAGPSDPPLISNLNPRPGPAVPNLVTVKLPPDGKVRLRNAAGGVHLLADVSGYYDAGPGGALFRPVYPTRILDTRSRIGTSPTAPTRVGPAGTVDLQVGGAARVPPTATAAVLNVTGVTASRTTDIRVFPRPASGSEVPRVSNLNLGPLMTAADLVVVKLGAAASVRLFNAAGEVGLVADVAGWFGPE